MADLSAFQTGEAYDPNEVFDVELRGPDNAPLLNDDGTPMTIGVIGLDSDEALRLTNAQGNAALKRAGKNNATMESLRAESALFLAKLTKRWNITMAGRPDFTVEAARALYAEPRFAFIREQVDAAIADRANFTKASPAS